MWGNKRGVVILKTILDLMEKTACFKKFELNLFSSWVLMMDNSCCFYDCVGYVLQKCKHV